MYWRSQSKHEVNLVVSDKCAIEIKSTELVVDKHLKGIRALKEEGLFKNYIVVSLDQKKRLAEDQIEIWPWKDFLQNLWDGLLF